MSSVKAKISASCMVYVDSDSTNNGLYLPKTLHENIRKTLGGSGEITVTASGVTATVSGYADGSPTYLQATSGGVELTGLAGDGSSDWTIYVKHTGHEWSSSSVLGDATTDTMNIVLTDTDGATALFTCTLSAGMVLILPDCLLASGCKILGKRGGSTDLALEYMYVPTT